MIRTLIERGGELVVAGDGKADSPGHCAKYDVYTIVDMNSGQVIGLHLVQVNK
jgi:solute carrier family 8 (sodium/calcium exchanger)